MAATRTSCRISPRPSSQPPAITSCMFSLSLTRRPQIIRQRDTVDLHGGESETAKMLIARPDLVHMDRARAESGADQARLKLPDELYTAIWWYARFPDHYSGDGSLATIARGKYEMDEFEKLIVKCIRAIKADQTSLQLQNEFFEKANHPLDTRP